MDTVKEIRKLLSSLKKNFQCTICLDFLSQPVSTKCNHQFCSGCLQDFIKSTVKGNKPCCPLCKSDLGTKRSLNPNPELSKIIAAVKDVCNAADKDCTNLDVSPLLSQTHKKFSAKKGITITKSYKKSLEFTSTTSKNIIIKSDKPDHIIEPDDIEPDKPDDIEPDNYFIESEKTNKHNKCRLNNKEKRRKKIKSSSDSSGSLEYEFQNISDQNSFKRRRIISASNNNDAIIVASVTSENPLVPISNKASLNDNDEKLVEHIPKKDFEYLNCNESSEYLKNLFLEDSTSNTINHPLNYESVQTDLNLIDDDATEVESSQPISDDLKETSILRQTQLSCSKEISSYSYAKIDSEFTEAYQVTDNTVRCNLPKSKQNVLTPSDSILCANEDFGEISSQKVHSPKTEIPVKTIEKQCENVLINGTAKSDKNSLLLNVLFDNDLSLKKRILTENNSISLPTNLPNSPVSSFQNSLVTNFSFFLTKIESPNKDKTLLGNRSFSKIDLSTRKNWHPLQLPEKIVESNENKSINNNLLKTLDSFENLKCDNKQSEKKHFESKCSDNDRVKDFDHGNKSNSQENLFKISNSTQESCLSGGENYLRKRKRKKRKIYSKENLEPESFEYEHSLAASNFLHNENLDHNKKENSVVEKELSVQNMYSEELIPPTPNMWQCGMQYKSEMILQTVQCETMVTEVENDNAESLNMKVENQFPNSFPQVSSQLLLDQIKQSKKLEIPINNEQSDITLAIEENVSKLSNKHEDKLVDSIKVETSFENVSPKLNNELYKKDSFQNEPSDKNSLSKYLQVFEKDSNLHALKDSCIIGIENNSVAESAGTIHSSDEILNSPNAKCLQQRENFLINDDMFCYDDIDVYTNEKKNIFSSKAKESNGSLGNDGVEKIYASDRFLSCSEEKNIEKCEEIYTYKNTNYEVINFLEKQFNEPNANEANDLIDFNISGRNFSNDKSIITEDKKTIDLVTSDIDKNVLHVEQLHSPYNLVDDKQQNVEENLVIKKRKRSFSKKDIKSMEELLNDSDEEINEKKQSCHSRISKNKSLIENKSNEQVKLNKSERKRAKQRLKKKKLLKQLKLLFTKIIVASSSSSSDSEENDNDDEDIRSLGRKVVTPKKNLEEKNLPFSPLPPLSPSPSSPPKSLIKSKKVSSYIDNLKQKLLAKPEDLDENCNTTFYINSPHVTEDMVKTIYKKSLHATEDVVKTVYKKSPHATEDVVKTIYKKLPHATEDVVKTIIKKSPHATEDVVKTIYKKSPHASEDVVKTVYKKSPHNTEDMIETFCKKSNSTDVAEKNHDCISPLDNMKSLFSSTKDQSNMDITKTTFVEKGNKKQLSENKSMESINTTYLQEGNNMKNVIVKDLSPNTPLRNKIMPVYQSTTLRECTLGKIPKIDSVHPPKKLSTFMQQNPDDLQKSEYRTHINNSSTNQFFTPTDSTKPSLTDISLKELSLTNNNNIQELKSPCIMISRLTKKQTSLCDLLCQKLKAKINQNFSDDVTHLVIGTDENNYIFKTSYTFKYLMALVSGIWIVSFHWVIQCLKNSKFVEEDSFEVKGDPSDGHEEIPAQYRIAATNRKNLLSGYCIWVQGTFQRSPIKKDQLVMLIKKLGAEVVFTLDEDDKYIRHIKITMVTDNLSEITTLENSLMVKYGLKPIHPEWLVQSVINFRIANENDWIVQD
ncbi:breast cancer type 1 susceptibility protein homolog isoform X2 [Hydra vulgaris]|uniref:breast cancer type 1 susceptibility protein homolog isoform X2 n=1 Tax=Hydra vulgaris TaxID=6087 RepID=UPI001F5FD557|nr:breast cancer type 1 susceptibility protein homolog isoform X2 [Hydra vulgaris]